MFTKFIYSAIQFLGTLGGAGGNTCQNREGRNTRVTTWAATVLEKPSSEKSAGSVPAGVSWGGRAREPRGRTGSRCKWDLWPRLTCLVGGENRLW